MKSHPASGAKLGERSPPADLADLSPRFHLFQERNDLALAELRLPHNTFLHRSMMAECSSYALCTSRGSLRGQLDPWLIWKHWILGDLGLEY